MEPSNVPGTPGTSCSAGGASVAEGACADTDTPGPPGLPGALGRQGKGGVRPEDRVADLTALHGLTARLTAVGAIDAALDEVLRAGAGIVGARRGLIVLEPPAGAGALTSPLSVTRGYGLSHAELGHIETVPRPLTAYGRMLEGTTEPTDPAQPHQPPQPADPADPAAAVVTGSQPAGPPADSPAPPAPQHSRAPQAGASPETPERSGEPDGTERAGRTEAAGRAPEPRTSPGGAPEPGPRPPAVAHPDILNDDSLDPLRREVAVRLGCAAAYTQPLVSGSAGVLGAAVWLYDEPAAPAARDRRLVDDYARYAAEHLARLAELAEARRAVAAVTEELLPGKLPRVPGVRLAARRLNGPHGPCGDWYDAIPLPEEALGLAVGSVGGTGPEALAAAGRLRASLRAYAVMEGEDPVAVLSDLELLLRLTEPAGTATALFAYAEPGAGKMVLAGAGHTPPLLIGERRTEFVETSLSAPLGMLACWEAPSVELSPQPGETVLLYTDGLLRRTGRPMDQAFAGLHAAAASVPRAAREDPGAVTDHVLRTLLPRTADPRGRYAGAEPSAGYGPDAEGAVLLAVRFD
ncbi:PP2C family protein-serine/threonine phosphatase [Streptomyces sp. NPDC003691]